MATQDELKEAQHSFQQVILVPPKSDEQWIAELMVILKAPIDAGLTKELVNCWLQMYHQCQCQ